MGEIKLLKLGVAFIVIMALIWRRRPLYQAILAGIIATAILHPIGPIQSVKLVAQVITDWHSMSLLLIIYLITFLQRMLEKRQQIKLALNDLNGLFNNRRINASIAPLFMGLLPSAAVMTLCGEIVNESTEGYLDKKEQAFVANWFRHIPESSLPTYTGVLLMSSLSGVAIPGFMLGMIPPILVMMFLGYFMYLRKLPRVTGREPSQNKWKDLLGLGQHLWALFLIIFLILAFKLSVITSVGISIALALLVYRFRPEELKPMFRSAFEPKMLGNTFLILVFKVFTEYTGAIHALPDFLSQFPIPLFLVFALLFFIGGIVTGTNGIIALGTTMAFTAIPNGGMPLMVLLMSMCHAASQVSPTHVCIAIITEYFDITMGDLARKSIPVVGIFCLFMIGYYQLLLFL